MAEASVASHLYRIAQEAVSNAVRHGEAHSVIIRLTKSGTNIRLEIRDDGKGLPPKLPTTRGQDLRTMRYRADTIGALLTVKRQASGGSVVSCLLPGGKWKKPATNPGP